MAIEGDILQFVVSGKVNGQVWQNVHHYLIGDASLSLMEGEFPDIIAAWIDWYMSAVYPGLYACTPQSMTWDHVKGENLFNVSEIGQVNFAPGTTGLGTVQPLAQFNAYGFSQPSGKRGMNPGSRRVPGVLEDGVGEYGAITGPFLINLNLAGAGMSEDVTLDYRGGLGEMFLRPVIVKRVRSGTGTDIDPYKYRLPRNLGERSYYLAKTWTADPVITSQNSRKTGRGI